MNPRHILIPIDRSALSLRPIEAAPELFENRKVTLLCAVENHQAAPMGAPLAPAIDEPGLSERVAQARADLEEAAATLPNASEVVIEVAVDNSASHAVGKYAKANDVDLIVLSTHGRTGFRRLALGSVAEAVLREAAVPVLAFPARQQEDD